MWGLGRPLGILDTDTGKRERHSKKHHPNILRADEYNWETVQRKCSNMPLHFPLSSGVRNGGEPRRPNAPTPDSIKVQAHNYLARIHRETVRRDEMLARRNEPRQRPKSSTATTRHNHLAAAEPYLIPKRTEKPVPAPTTIEVGTNTDASDSYAPLFVMPAEHA